MRTPAAGVDRAGGSRQRPAGPPSVVAASPNAPAANAPAARKWVEVLEDVPATPVGVAAGLLAPPGQDPQVVGVAVLAAQVRLAEDAGQRPAAAGGIASPPPAAGRGSVPPGGASVCAPPRGRPAVGPAALSAVRKHCVCGWKSRIATPASTPSDRCCGARRRAFSTPSASPPRSSPRAPRPRAQTRPAADETRG